MRVTFTVAIIGLWCGVARADDDASFVSGTWIGTGVLQMEDQITACKEVAMKFSGSSTSYSFAGASLKCGDTNRDFPAADVHELRKDGQVYFRDVPVGRVDPGHVHIDNPVAVGNQMSDDYTIIRRGDVLLFTEAMGRPATTPRFSFVAILKRAQEPAEH